MIHRSTYPNPSIHTHKHKSSNHQQSHTHTNHQTNWSQQRPPHPPPEPRHQRNSRQNSPHLQRNPPPICHNLHHKLTRSKRKAESLGLERPIKPCHTVRDPLDHVGWDSGQRWPEGEQREREKSLRESKGRGRNLRERRGRQTWESGRVRETEWREKKNKIIFLVLQ